MAELGKRAPTLIGVTVLLLSAVIAALNISPWLTAVALGVASAALYGAIVTSGKLEVAQILPSESRTVRLKDHAETSAAARALFGEAEKSLKIVAGWLGPGIYFNEEVFAACRYIVARGGEITIIVGEPGRKRDDIRKRALPELWEQFETWIEQGSVKFLKARRREQPHFAIIDDVHVWDEDLHDPEDLGHAGRVVYYDDRVAIFNKRFEELKNSSDSFLSDSSKFI